MSGQPLSLERVHVRLGDREVLRDVSLDVGAGEWLAVVGPNGAGKSTLLRTLLRIVPPSAGRILLDGRPLAALEQRALARRIGYVPQTLEGPVPYSVYEFVLMARYAHFLPLAAPSGTDREAVRAALTRTGTESLAERRMSTLSGGERQRVMVAAVIAQGADILLLDEPTAFLDYRYQDELHALLGELHGDGGTTLIVVSHDINAAVLWSDRVLLLSAGSVAYLGSPEGVVDNDVLAPVFGKRFVLAEHPDTGQPVVLPERKGRGGQA